MSSTTENLGLTLPAGSEWADVEVLNENWEKIDAAVLRAMAAAAAYNAGATYQQGDFCTQGGLLYRANQAIAQPEAWTAGHWTAISITDVIRGLTAADVGAYTKEEISSLLLKKVSVPIEIAANSDLNNFRNCGFYFCGNGGETISNKPGTSDAFGAFSLLVQKTGSWGGNGVNQILTDYTNGNLYVRSSENASWTVWKELATTADLANYLPLSGGTLTGALKSTSPLNGIQIIATDTRSTKIMKNASAAVEDGTHIVDYADGKYTTLKISARTNSVSLRDSSGGDNIIYGAHNVTTGTTALTAGSSALATGAYYNQYE